MATTQSTTESVAVLDPLHCVEHGIWTPVPTPPPPGDLRLRLKDVDPGESRNVRQRGVLTFHLAGCTGDPKHTRPLQQVAAAMAAQVAEPGCHGGDTGAAQASFFLHLGDIVYKGDNPDDPRAKDQQTLYNDHFYTPYAGYPRSIFALAGNHDGKNSKHPERSPIQHFLKNFCDPNRAQSPDNRVSKRPAMPQPYPYWLLQTPLAYLVCLYANDVNGGQLDDPEGLDHPQYDWLVRTLTALRKAADDRAVLLAVHYPPYSAAANFPQRGDPNLGPTPRPRPLQPLGMILQQAFRESKQYPDAVFSAHAHHYQRITYTHGDGRQIPYLIVGSGGHSPIEPVGHGCDGTEGPAPALPCDVVRPAGLKLPKGDRAQLVAYNDRDFGFLRVTLNAQKKTLVGEFFAAHSEVPGRAGRPALHDWFVLDLRAGTLV
jgi:hypothetical protein